MNVIFFGTPYFVLPIAEILHQKYNLVAVVTAPDKPVGRKQILTPTPVKQFAIHNNIPVFTPENLLTAKSQLPTADLSVVAAYGKIIPKDLLDLPKHGAINIHPSALPTYRGPSPITQTLLNGDKTSAISIMQMDEKMDHGPIIKSFPYEIPEDATTESLTPEMFLKSAALLPEVIDDYVAGKLKPEEQNHEKATYTHIIKKEDGYIDLDNPPSPDHLDRMIRAYYPWPTVWTNLEILLLRGTAEAGGWKTKRIKFLPKNKIQMEGKNPVSIKDFLNGYPELKQAIERLF